MPEDSNKTKIPLEIRDHEYCGTGRRKRIGDVEIHGYTRGFDQVRDTIRGTPYPFNTYLEHLRFLVTDLLPELESKHRHP